MAIIHENKYIVSRSLDKTLRVWNLEEKRQEDILLGHSNRVWPVAIIHDDKYVLSEGSDNNIRVWNFYEKLKKKKHEETVLKGHTGAVYH